MNDTYHSPQKNTFHWPDIRQNRVNMVKCYSSDIWKYESSRRPNYKGWRKETEALLKPPHLKQVSWGRKKNKNKLGKIIQEYFIYSTSAIPSHKIVLFILSCFTSDQFPYHLLIPILLQFCSKWNQESPTFCIQTLSLYPIFPHIINYQGLLISPLGFPKIYPFSPSSLLLLYLNHHHFLTRLLL